MKGYLSTLALLLLSSHASATQLEIKNLEYRYPNSTEMQYSRAVVYFKGKPTGCKAH